MVGDFDGNEYDDLLCHDTSTGLTSIRYSRPRPFQDVQWSTDRNWCVGGGKKVYTGDFNGDGKTDLCCHTTSSGRKGYAFATYDGRFNGELLILFDF